MGRAKKIKLKKPHKALEDGVKTTGTSVGAKRRKRRLKAVKLLKKQGKQVKKEQAVKKVKEGETTEPIVQPPKEKPKPVDPPVDGIKRKTPEEKNALRKIQLAEFNKKGKAKKAVKKAALEANMKEGEIIEDKTQSKGTSKSKMRRNRKKNKAKPTAP